MITARENFLRALCCEETEWMPFFFVIDNFNYPDSLPLELLEPFDPIRIQRYLGGALLDRLGPPPVVRKCRRLKYTSMELEDGVRRCEWEMPEGKITGYYRQPSEAGTTFLEKHGITDRKGYEVLIAMAEDAEVCVDPVGVEGTRARLAEIGEGGILYSVGPASPIMDLMRSWVGIEQFVYHLHDFGDLVEKTMEAMARKNYEEYELLAASTPAQVIVFWDDVTSLHMSPAMFRKYVLPYYRNVADICHGHGKILVCHTCGKVNAFLTLFPETDIDAIDWLTPPETGDVILSEAQSLFRGRIAIMGAVVPAVMRFGTPEDVEQHIREILHGVDTRDGFIFMVPAPVGSPMENVRKAREVVEKFAL